MRRVLLLTLVCAAGVILLAAPAGAAGAKNKAGAVPKDSAGTGAVTIKQLTEDLQFLLTEKNGIVINFVLPRGWELVEEGIDKKTGKLREDLGMYALVSRAPVAKKDDPTDLIFELDIYKHSLVEGLPKDATEKERDPGYQLWNFLNAQITMNIKSGRKCVTKVNEIKAKAYGPPTRDQTMFVPIFYEVPAPPKSGGKSAMLYTFTSMVGDKVWMMKFLVNSEQLDNYGALIALVLNNSFGMTKAEYDAFMARMAEQQKAGTAKGVKPKGTP